MYYLPLGVPLPAGTVTQSGCTACLRATMEGFRGFKGGKAQPLGATYDAAATMVGNVCGAAWLNQSSAVKSDGVRRQQGGALWVFLAVAVGVFVVV